MDSSSGEWNLTILSQCNFYFFQIDHEPNDTIIRKIRFIQSLIFIHTHITTNQPHHNTSNHH
jgi:hypothetical protein